MTTQYRLTGDITSPGTARRVSASALAPVVGDAPWGKALTHDTMLIASELVTNATNAGGTHLELSVSVHRSRVRVSVFDDALGLPQVIAAGSTDLRGRGLALTAALAVEWGVDLAPNGKQVWADLPVPVDLVLSGTLDECHEPPLVQDVATG